jgi:phosphoserine phosphatase
MNDTVRAARAERVLEVARRLGAESELGPLLGIAAQAAREVLGAERVTVFRHDAGSKELVARLADGIPDLRIPATGGIAGETLRSRTTIAVPDAYADPRFNPDVDRRTGFRTVNILSVPLLGSAGDATGVLQLINIDPGSLAADGVRLAETLAAQIGVAVERAGLLESRIEARAAQVQLDLARRIQAKMLPTGPMSAPPFTFHSWGRPAEHAGGDCFDHHRDSDGSILFFVGDASGHGIGPALIGMSCRSLLRGAADARLDLKELVARTDRLLTEQIPDDRFVTLCLGRLHPSDGAVELLSAGHGPIVLVRASGEATFIDAHGPPLGSDLGADLWDEPSRLTLGPGDSLVIATDGFVEWASADDECFGNDRFLGVLSATRNEPPAARISALVRATEAFGQPPQPDDMTILLLERAG